MNIIINADDLGYHSAVNSGICNAFTKGVLSSASLMANGEAFEEAVAQIKTLNIPTGIHFNLTTGYPVSNPNQIPTLLQDSGLFWEKWQFARRLISDKINPDHIKCELSGQLLKCLDFGVVPDHFDGHHHVHLLPGIARMVFQLTRNITTKYRSLSRPSSAAWALSPLAAVQQIAFNCLNYKQYSHSVTPDYFMGMELLYNQDKEKTLLTLLKHIKPGTTEIMCHPGYLVPDSISIYNKGREQELSALTGNKINKILQSDNIKVISFRELA